MSIRYILSDLLEVTLRPPLACIKWYVTRIYQVLRHPEAIIRPGARIGLGTQLSKNAWIGNDASLQNCSVGRFSYFGIGAELVNCSVGAFCSIGPHVMIGLGKHPTNFVSTSPAFYARGNWAFRTKFTNRQAFEEHARIEIGNDVWVGAGVTVADGVKIGDGAIVAAGAVVVKDVEPYGIVGGVPAKLIRKRFSDEQIRRLLELKWWEKPEEWLKAHSHLFFNVEDLLEISASARHSQQSLPALPPK